MVTTRRRSADAITATSNKDKLSHVELGQKPAQMPPPDTKLPESAQDLPLKLSNTASANSTHSISEDDRSFMSASQPNLADRARAYLTPNTKGRYFPSRRLRHKSTIALCKEDDDLTTDSMLDLHLKRKTELLTANFPDQPPRDLYEALVLNTGHMDNAAAVVSHCAHKKDNASPVPLSQKSQLTPARSFLGPKSKTIVSQGTAQDPIVLGNSPILQSIQPQKRKRFDKQERPHKFLDRGYRELYSYRPPRPELAPQPANGTTFTGDKSHDIYRMMSAKIEAEGGVRPVPQRHAGHALPFDAQYSLLTQALTQPFHNFMIMPPAYTGNGTDPQSHHASQLLSEDSLRNKALQYIRQYSTASPRKHDFTTSDLDQSSNIGSEHAPHSSHHRQFSVYIDADAEMYHLKDIADLVASLWKVYPSSTNKLALREDIDLLLAAQEKAFRKWAEKEEPREHRMCEEEDTAEAVRAAERAARDVEMRAVLSSSAGMWQGDESEILMDVFAAEVEELED